MTRIIPCPRFTGEHDGICHNESIQYVQDASISSEGYELYITDNSVTVKFSDEPGKYYACKTLEQIKLLNCGTLPCMTVKDSPRFSYRGFMIDCARHMFSVDELKKMIDAASDFKFNRFHWHLSDDQGFRIELENYPEITEKGSVRPRDTFGSYCRNNTPYGGYYTKNEIRDIAAFCNERHIEVIPEIDLPGHVSAILSVHPELSCRGKDVEIKTGGGIFRDVFCLGNDKSFELIKGIIDEICELFDCEYFHIGGDEVPDFSWKHCDKCKAKMRTLGISDYRAFQGWFENEINSYIKAKGKKCISWNESLKGDNLDKDITVECWNDMKHLTAKAANYGTDVIFAPMTPYYCNFPYSMHTLKEVYSYDPYNEKCLTEYGREHIIGVEAPVWTENTDNNARLERLCFPRWAVIAEGAWTLPGNKDYAKFESSLKIINAKMKSDGYNTAEEERWNGSVFNEIRGHLDFGFKATFPR